MDLVTFDFSPLWISLKVATTAIFFTFFLGITAAYSLLEYRGKWKTVFDSIFLAPLVLPPTVVGFLLLQLFGQYGWMGKFLQLFHLNIIFTWYAGVIAAVVVTFPLMYKTAQGAFEQVDRNLLSAAKTLGASELQVFWQIALPLAFPGILAGAMLAFARGLGEFGATLMIAGNIPKQTTTIPLAIFAAVEAGANQEAWLWTAIILSMSFSAIALSHLWASQRERGKGIEVRGEIKSNYELRITNYGEGLVIDFQKQLPEFTLQVALQVAMQSNDRSIAVLGASGTGKSMLLKCIAGIENPSGGRIVINGKVLFDSTQNINLSSRDRHIGFVFQNYALFPHLTVAQNIAFGLPKELTRSQIKRKVAKQLQSIDLQGFGDRYPHKLSGGQQQRVALARALVSQPDILLLDEPFSALDTHLRSQMERELISVLSHYSGITLFVTHNIDEAYRICQNLLILDRGQVISYGEKSEIFAHPANVETAKLTGCKNFSRIEAIAPNLIAAVDWGCQLRVNYVNLNSLTHVGIRAHHITFLEKSVHTDSPNTFLCWLVRTTETPHRMTLYIKLNTAPNHDWDYHLQVELFKEKWLVLYQCPLPWRLCLDPSQLFLLYSRKSDS